MTSLTDFLLARIGEVETAVWNLPPVGQDGSVSTAAKSVHEYLSLFDPARVLARCEADRRLVEWHKPLPPRDPRYADNREGCWEDGGMDGAPLYPCRNLRFLALPYADHPDYDEAWRPNAEA